MLFFFFAVANMETQFIVSSLLQPVFSKLKLCMKKLNDYNTIQQLTAFLILLKITIIVQISV
jgi:hypothetical protein